LAPTGRAYFAVRRDIQRDGFRTHVKHGVSVYQCNVKLPYLSILRTEHCEIYEYRPYNRMPHPDAATCPFCAPEAERELITESATTFAIFDKYPVSPGHALIIPKKHIANYFDLSTHVKTACWLMADRVQQLLIERFHPDGFNVGINVGATAGQTVPHVHIHLIPRYSGDAEDPTGGVRHVIPGKGNYRKMG
jgi:diadenosine tetraphosphate (Ap4A) HIT family hydrolase